MNGRLEVDLAENESLSIHITLEQTHHYHVGDKVHSQPPRGKELLESRKLQDELMVFGEQNGATAKKESRSIGGLRRQQRHHFDGGVDKTAIETAMLIFSTIGGATAFFNLGKDLLLKWMENKTSKSIRLKAGDLEVEIKGSDDIDRAIEILEKLREVHAKKKKGK